MQMFLSFSGHNTGTAQQVFEWGGGGGGREAKEECVKEISFGRGGGGVGGMPVDFYSISLK